MHLNDREKFVQMVSQALAYYRQDCTEFVLNLWWQACKDFTIEQVSKALTKHAMDPDRGQFAPKVADVVRVLAGTKTDRALLAWGKVHSAMSDVGAYADVCFDDAAINAVVHDLGGWPKVCRTSLDDLSYLQHRFCEAHRAYTERGQFEYPRQLIGDRSADAEYVKRGITPPAPILIGDKTRAMQVHRAQAQDSISQLAHEAQRRIAA